MKLENSKLIKFITQLSRKEQIRFKEYLLSPYFNKQENLIKLWSFLYKSIKKQAVFIDKRKLFENLFPNKPYHEQILKNLLSALMNHLLSFMGIQQFMTQPVRGHLAALDYALDNRMFEFIDFNKKRALKLLGNDSVIRLEHELYLSQFYDILCRKDLMTKNKVFDEKKVLEHLDNYQIAKRLKTYCEILSDNEKFKNPEIIAVGKRLKKYVTENWESLKNNPLISIYYKILNLHFSDNSLDVYMELRAEQKEIKNKLAIIELEEIYSYLEGFCIRRVNAGISEAQIELFNLYQEQLDLPAFQLTEVKYRNIAVIGCRLGKLDWVATFLENRKKDLHLSNRENAYLFNLAAVETYRKNYDKALGFLNQIEVTNTSYYKSVKYALIKIYYDLEEFDSINYVLESFRIYMLRNKNRFEKNQVRATFNFIKLVEKLIKLRTSSFSKKEFSMKVAALQQKVLETDVLINKGWLLEKLDAF